MGYELFKRNIPNLLGQGVDVETINDIVSIIKANSYVIEVKDPKGMLTGIHKFRFSADITYDEKVRLEINSNIFLKNCYIVKE